MKEQWKQTNKTNHTFVDFLVLTHWSFQAYFIYSVQELIIFLVLCLLFSVQCFKIITWKCYNSPDLQSEQERCIVELTVFKTYLKEVKQIIMYFLQGSFWYALAQVWKTTSILLRIPAFIHPLNILCEALGAHSSACNRRGPSSFTSDTDIASRAETEGGMVRRSL